MRKNISLGAVLGILVFIALLFAGLLYGLYRVVVQLSPKVLAVWALVATLLAPVIGLLCYKIGHLHARGVLAGLAMGLGTAMKTAGEVVKVASATSEVKINTARGVSAAQAQVREPLPAPTLPTIVVIETPGEGKEVLL